MKVLTLTQPWATLVVIGAKKVETRGFNTKFSGESLISSSLKSHPDEKRIMELPYFKEALAGITLPLPKGKIIGMVTVDGTFKTENANSFFFEDDYGRWYDNTIKDRSLWELAWQKNCEREKAFGDYSPGRFGWELWEPVAFTNQVPFKGGVGWTKSFDEKICLLCGCTDDYCPACIEKTGAGCSWVKNNLCSACSQVSIGSAPVLQFILGKKDLPEYPTLEDPIREKFLIKDMNGKPATKAFIDKIIDWENGNKSSALETELNEMFLIQLRTKDRPFKIENPYFRKH